MLKLGLRPRYSRKGIHKWYFRCSVGELLMKVKKYRGLASWMSSSVMTIELSSCEYQQGKTTLCLPNSAAKSAHTTLRTL
jgi:hypothetical protein